MMIADWVERAAEANKITWDQLRPLMNQLVERVLAVGARLAPVDRPGLVTDRRAADRHALAVRFHRQLLQVGREALEVLIVGQHGDRLRAEEVVVPDRKQ